MPVQKTPKSKIDKPSHSPKRKISQAPTKKIHPIIIYPFSHPRNTKDIKALYENLIAKLNAEPNRYARPITVLNRQTYYTNTLWKYEKGLNKAFKDFLEKTIKPHSDILNAWCVDTCQMWVSGFGKAYDDKSTGDDAYWLIPGDFNYSEGNGPAVLEEMTNLPNAVIEHDQDICLGEVEASVNSSKQLIDTYGTYGLMYNWFPREAQEIRSKTNKPRTEFFAISHSFLREVLRQRWYAYEQTIVILLQAVMGKKRIHTEKLGSIIDLPQGRDNLSAAMQQVERTERVLKLFWREKHQQQTDWPERFKKLDSQSGQIRVSALVILENLLVYP